MIPFGRWLFVALKISYVAEELRVNRQVLTL